MPAPAASSQRRKAQNNGQIARSDKSPYGLIALAMKEKDSPWSPPNRARFTSTTQDWGRKVLSAAAQKGFSAPVGSIAGFQQLIRLSEQEQMTRPYIQSAWVYVCVNARARAMVAPKRELWVGDPDDEGSTMVENPADPLAVLMRKPNPCMSARKFWMALEMFYCLAGGSYLFLTKTERRRGGTLSSRHVALGSQGVELPDEIWPVREDLVEPVLDDESKVPIKYKISTGSGEVTYPAYAVAHVYHMDPDNPIRGAGPMQAAYRRANVSFKAEALDDALLENGGQMQGFFSPDGSQISDEQARTWTRSFKEHMRTNHGGRPVVPAGMKFTPTSFKPSDMDWANGRVWDRDAIVSVFGCTKPVVGITDDVNRANAEAALAAFYENTVQPQGDFWEDELSTMLFEGLEPPYDEYRLRFNYANIRALQVTEDQKLERMDKLIGWGLTLREAAQMVRYDIRGDIPDESIDLRILSNSYTILNVGGGPASQPPAPPARTPEAREADEAEETKDAPTEEPEKVFRSGLNRAARRVYWKQFDDALQAPDERLRRRAEEVYRKFVRAQERRFEDVAGGRGIREREAGEAEATRVFPWEDLDRKRAEDGEDIWLTVRQVTEPELEELLISNLEKWNRQLWRAVESPLRDVIQSSASSMASQLGVNVFPTTTNPAMLRYLSQMELVFAEGGMAEFARQVRTVTIQALANGEGLGSLQERLAEVLPDLKDAMGRMRVRSATRAAMVARTETTAAANGARAEQMKQAGITQHEWLSAADEAVRDGHSIDGDVATVGEKFRNGMRWPGDEDAPVGMRVNDRCTTLPVQDDEGATAP